MTDCVLELRQLTRHYATHKAVDGVSLQVPQGSFFSLVGPSGCGKTTTLRLIAGFEQPTSGDVVLRGRSLNGRRPHERNVSTVFQNYALFPHLSVQGNIEFGLKRKGVTDLRRRVADVLDLVRLRGKERSMPSQLSGGERQRVALARSLATQPDVLLLDEPLSALDPNLRKQVRAELKSLQRETGTTFLFITHDREEALSMSDTIAVMRCGRLEQCGTPEELYVRPKTRFVASFLGAMNWVNGLGVRPELTRLSHQPPDSDVPHHAARVTNSVFLGNCIQVEARLLSGEPVLVELPRANHCFQRGDTVHVWWHPADEVHLQDYPE